MKQILQILTGWFKPRFHEIMTYQAAITCLLLVFTYPELFQTYDLLVQSDIRIWMLAISAILGIGLIFSIWNVFTRRKKSIVEKEWMGAFALVINGLAGIAAGIEIFPARWSILALFPIWNILYGVILLYQVGFAGAIVTDDNASLLEVIIATGSLLVLFGLAKFGFHFSWAMTFSVCMFYSSFATMAISRLITQFDWNPFKVSLRGKR